MSQDIARKAIRITDGSAEATIDLEGRHGRVDTRDEQMIVLLTTIHAELVEIKMLLLGAV